MPNFFIEFRINVSSYSWEFDSFPVKTPTTTYTNPKSSIFNNNCIQLYITSNFSKIVGLNQNKYYPTTSNYQSNYGITSAMEKLIPNANPINSIIVRCDLVSNDMTVPSDILFSFNASSNDYGKNIFIQ